MELSKNLIILPNTSELELNEILELLLTPRQIFVVKQKFWENEKPKGVAKKLNIRRETVDIELKKAIEKLQKYYEISPPKKIKYKDRPIYQIKDDNIIKKWNNVFEASKELKINLDQIKAVANKTKRKTLVKGTKFEYVNKFCAGFEWKWV